MRGINLGFPRDIWDPLKGVVYFSTRAGGKRRLPPNERSTSPMWFHIKPSWFWVKLMPKVSKNITRTPKNVFLVLWTAPKWQHSAKISSQSSFWEVWRGPEMSEISIKKTFSDPIFFYQKCLVRKNVVLKFFSVPKNLWSRKKLEEWGQNSGALLLRLWEAYIPNLGLQVEGA